MEDTVGRIAEAQPRNTRFVLDEPSQSAFREDAVLPTLREERAKPFGLIQQPDITQSHDVATLPTLEVLAPKPRRDPFDKIDDLDEREDLEQDSPIGFANYPEYEDDAYNSKGYTGKDDRYDSEDEYREDF